MREILTRALARNQESNKDFVFLSHLNKETQPSEERGDRHGTRQGDGSTSKKKALSVSEKIAKSKAENH